MEIGKLNRRITYTLPGALVSDGYGGNTRPVAGTSVTTWCNAKPLSQEKILLYGLTTGQRAYIFSFRYDIASVITNIATLTYESRTFIIKQILEVDEARKEIKILASERTN